MPAFGSVSSGRLITCHPLLVNVFLKVVEDDDCTILCGARSKFEQNAAFLAGTSHCEWPNSKHNVRDGASGSLPELSRALDAFPVPEHGWPIKTEDWHDTKRFYWFGGKVIATARSMGIPLRWGGNWDGDHQLTDQRLFDLVHWELL